MRNSENNNTALPAKKKGKIITRILAVVILIGTICTIEVIAQMCFDKRRSSDYVNYDVKRIMKSGEAVDMIVMGASQAHHAFNTVEIADEMGYQNVLLGSVASEALPGSYHLLKYYLKHFDPKYVVMELSWNRVSPNTDTHFERSNLLVSDRLPWPEKIAFAFDSFAPEEFKNLSAMYRFGGTVWGFNQIKGFYEERQRIAQGKGDPMITDTIRYVKNGFFYYMDGEEQGGITLKRAVYDPAEVDPDQVEYLDKITQLCEEEGTQLMLVTLPATLCEIYGIENHEQSAEYFADYAKEHDLIFLNYNYLKGREESFPDNAFTDAHHLTGDASLVFSDIFCSMLKEIEAGKDVSGYFYDDPAEMISKVTRIVGSCADLEYYDNDKKIKVTVDSVQNEGVIPEYRLLVSRDIGKTYDEEVVPWTTDTVFKLNAKDFENNSLFKLEVRQKGKKEVEAFQDMLSPLSDTELTQLLKLSDAGLDLDSDS